MRIISKTSLLVLVSLITVPVWSQQSPDSYVDSILDLKITNTQKVTQLENYFESLPKETELLEDGYYLYSRWYYGYVGDDKAQLYGEKERVLRLKKFSPKEDKTKRNLYNLGYFYHNSNNPKLWKAKAYYDTLVSVSEDREVRLGKAYGELGVIYDKWGDFQNALEHFLLAEQILKDQKYNNMAIKVLNNILAMYVELNDPIYLNDFIEIKKKIETYDPSDVSQTTEASIINNTAAMYQIAGLSEDAEKSALKSFKIYKDLNSLDKAFNAISLLGVIETEKNNFDKARDYFNQSYTYTEERDIPLSNISNNLGSLEFKIGNYKKALDHYYSAISLITKGDSFVKKQLPSLSEISISPNKKLLFSYLYDASNAWIAYYEKNQNEEYLQQALNVLKYADTASDELFLESQEELSKLSWRKKAAPLYMNAIKVAHLLNKPEVAFYYMEKKKGLLLLENTTETLAKQRANIPQEILEAESNMTSSISSYLDIIENTPLTKTTANQIKKAKKELFSIKRKYRKFIDSIGVLYPIYRDFKKQLNVSSLENIKETLQANEYIINYALGDSLGYAMLISNSEIQLKQIPVSIATLQQQIQEFQQILTRPFTTSQEITRYKKRAANLSSILLPFTRFRESVPKSSLVVIPDGIIQKVPFEALVLSEELNIPEAYFINTYNTTYKYSHSLDERITQLRPSENKSISFLPTDFKDDYLEKLPNSIKEASEIARYYEGQMYTNEDATKALFLDQYEDNSIIHISTHGGTDNYGPWLAFYNEKLRLEELYSTKNRKELIVLSACKTDVGDLKIGEGVFSIKRGFFKAGARSVISTLWNVNEKANMEIITSFYKELASGKKKSEALRNAKLSYLKKHANTSQASPYYWSGITLTGHDNTIDLGLTSYRMYLWIFISICLLILLFFLGKRYFANNITKRK